MEENLTEREKLALEKARKRVRDTEVRRKLDDIELDIVWGKIAKRYFSKSVSWLYNKLSCIDGNGGEGGFTSEELEQLRGALFDLSDRIRKAAEKL